MKRTRVAAILKMENGYAFMHRKDVKNNKELKDYYTFPGGGLEEGETLEEGVIREIEEEFGIKVKVIKKLYEIQSEKFNGLEIFFLCEYISGKFGTGTGPEFDNNPAYADCGKYIPEIIEVNKIKDILLVPQNVKEMFLEDLKNTKF